MAKKTIDSNGKTNWFSDKNSLNWIQRTINNVGNAFNSWLKGQTKEGLTNADLEANAFNASEAEKARAHDIYMSENKYQMETQSMQNAGVNPAMVYGGGNLVSTHATGTAASSVSPSATPDLVSTLMALVRMPMEMKNLQAQNRLATSQANLNNAEASNLAETERGQKLSNDYADEYYELRNEGQRLANGLSEEQRDNLKEERKRIVNETYKLAQDAKTSEEQALYYRSAAILNGVNAEVAAYMAPFNAAYTQAATAREKAQAFLNGVQAAYQQGLIDSGYITAMVKELEERAKNLSASTYMLSAQTIGVEFDSKLRSGKLFKLADWGDNPIVNVLEDVYNGVVTLPANNGIAIMNYLFNNMPSLLLSPSIVSSKPKPIKVPGE